MVTAVAVLALLQAGSDTHGVRLIEDLPAAPSYEQMSRLQQRAEYRSLDEQRPGLALPVLGITLGAVGAFTSSIVFWSMFTTPYGLAVYAAVLLIAAAIVSVAMIVGGIALNVHNQPQRDALGEKLHKLEDAYRQGRCRTEPGLPPCSKDPYGPPQTVPSNGFVPQVSAPAPEPSLVVARF
jgi:hypothetical protein